jgi:hypothetical protein
LRRKGNLHSADAQKCLPRTAQYEKCDFWSLVCGRASLFLVDLLGSVTGEALGAAAAQHRFYVCEKQIKFYAIGRSSAGGGGSQLPFLLRLHPSPTTRETDRPPLWAHRFSALSPRARIIESKCQAPHTHEKPLETHTDCQQQNVLHTPLQE